MELLILKITVKCLSWNEKPEIKSKINMGCYVMEPNILNFIPKNKPYGMDNVIKKVISKRKTISSILVKKWIHRCW